MGHHINRDGQFQSDKYPDLSPDKIVLSFNDPDAIPALRLFATDTEDLMLADDIRERLSSLGV